MGAPGDARLTSRLVSEAIAARRRIEAGSPDHGDKQLMHRLVEASVNFVARYVRGQVGPPDFDDVLQEIAVAAYQGLLQVRDPDAFMGWLKVVATRKCWKANWA